MPFARPTLGELIARIKEDFRSRLELTSAVLRRALVSVASSVWAGAVHMLHGHLDWAVRQLFPQTAEIDQLLVYGRPYGLTRTAATYATGTATATGTNGTPIPVDTILRRDDGVTYRVTAEATISGGTATLSLEASDPGDDGDADAGVVLTFESPIENVNSDATVVIISGGNDEESVEDFRSRLIARLREPPQGGADHDYVAWAREVAGVTRAWAYPHELGLGTVVVRFVRDDDADIIPSAAEVLEVFNKIQDERPITVQTDVLAPVSAPINFTLSISPDTAAVRSAVEDELADLIERDAAPGDGEGLGVILHAKMLVAIASAEGLTNFSLASPAADVTPTAGELPVLGTVTFT